MAGIAFFDFDYTLIDGDAGPLFGRYLVDQQYQTNVHRYGKQEARRRQAKLLARYLPYLASVGVQSGLYKFGAIKRSQLVRNTYRGLRGVNEEEYLDQIDDFVEQVVLDMAFPEMMDRVREHLAQGDEVVVISTGIRVLIQSALDKLAPGVKVLACELESEDGEFTGRADGPLYGQDKANMIRAYATSKGVDLGDCYAYTDHFSDVHMLRIVGHGVTVNPSGKLLSEAKDKGWEILRPARRPSA